MVNPQQVIARRHRKLLLKKGVSHLILLAGTCVMLFPLVWLVSSAFKPSNEIFGKTFQLIPKTFTLENFTKGWYTNPQYSFGYFVKNTVSLVAKVLVGSLLSCSLTAYALSKLRFPLRKLWFSILLLTLMVPSQVTMIPTYILFTKLEWLNTELPFVIPAFCATAPFYVFLLYQYMRTIPNELSEAARIDGCSNLMIFLKIILPLSRNALFSVTIFCFLDNWNDFLRPLIYLTSVRNYTISIVLKSIVDVTEAASWGNLMALSLLSVLPCIVIFFCAQRYFMEGIATTGLKG